MPAGTTVTCLNRPLEVLSREHLPRRDGTRCIHNILLLLPFSSRARGRPASGDAERSASALDHGTIKGRPSSARDDVHDLTHCRRMLPGALNDRNVSYGASRVPRLADSSGH